MFGLGMQELVIIGMVAVLLFGKRLPEVARSMGKYYRDFKRSLTDIQGSIDFTDTAPSRARSSYSSSSSSSSSRSYDDYDYDDLDEATAPKFEPPPSEPQAAASEEEKVA